MKVAGFGFRKEAQAVSLASALKAVGGADGVELLATLDAKADATCLANLAADLGLPVMGISEANLATIPTVTHSDESLAATGTGCLSEASALAAAGLGARLVAPRSISEDRMATCAIAEGDAG